MYTECPNCGKDLTYDEVDIGVGTLTGNHRCDWCGWLPEDPLKFMKEQYDK